MVSLSSRVLDHYSQAGPASWRTRWIGRCAPKSRPRMPEYSCGVVKLEMYSILYPSALDSDRSGSLEIIERGFASGLLCKVDNVYPVGCSLISNNSCVL